MKKKIQIFYLSILFYFILFTVLGQVNPIKTYSGKFENGNATYSFFDNNLYERIYHGKFIYNENVVKYSGLKLVIIGKFINNLRDGEWSFVVRNIKSPVIELVTETEKQIIEMQINNLVEFAVQMGASVPYKEIQKARSSLKNKVFCNSFNSVLKGSYLEGKLNGKWTYQTTLTGSKKNPINSTVFFRDNKLIGDFLYIEKEKNFVKGQFTDSGFIDGKWIIKWVNIKNEEYENIRIYKEGVLVSMVERNVITGDIKYQNDKENTSNFLSSNYRQGNGIEIMIKAVEFWLKPKKGILNMNIIDAAQILDRNYSYRFERGLILPYDPFQYYPKSNPDEPVSPE